ARFTTQTTAAHLSSTRTAITSKPCATSPSSPSVTGFPKPVGAALQGSALNAAPTGWQNRAAMPLGACLLAYGLGDVPKWQEWRSWELDSNYSIYSSY
ncbi:MAG: hypothetical protein KDK78_09110, partial [Chlamydiia bacterium]|nr:hypothetical protein [Chlamydiia bacterium]